jgi:hypothetical protein
MLLLSKVDQLESYCWLNPSMLIPTARDDLDPLSRFAHRLIEGGIGHEDPALVPGVRVSVASPSKHAARLSYVHSVFFHFSVGRTPRVC